MTEYISPEHANKNGVNTWLITIKQKNENKRKTIEQFWEQYTDYGLDHKQKKYKKFCTKMQ